MKQTGGLCGAGGLDPVDPARSGFLLGADAAGLDPSDTRSEDRCRLGRPSFRRFADGSLHRNDPRIPAIARDETKCVKRRAGERPVLLPQGRAESRRRAGLARLRYDQTAVSRIHDGVFDLHHRGLERRFEFWDGARSGAFASGSQELIRRTCD